MDAEYWKNLFTTLLIDSIFGKEFHKAIDWLKECMKEISTQLLDNCEIDYDGLKKNCFTKTSGQIIEMLLKNKRSFMLRFVPRSIVRFIESNIADLLDKLIDPPDRSDCDKPPPPPQTPVSTPVEWPVPTDPNEIIRHGITGVGQLNFIQSTDEFKYTILFENYFNASVPARDVYVQLEIDENFDVSSFAFGSFGFGNFTVQVPYLGKFSQLVLVPNISSYCVNFEAYVDEKTRTAKWKFATLDLKSLQPVDDVDVGFLPPNKYKSGEGFVTFKVNKNNNCSTMCELKAQASIIFDINDPILTNVDRVTLDDISPHVAVDYVEQNDEFNNTSSYLNINSNELESGIKYLKIYTKENLTNQYVLENRLTFRSRINLDYLESNKTYEFQVESEDNVGNVQQNRTYIKFYKSATFNQPTPGEKPNLIQTLINWLLTYFIEIIKNFINYFFN